MSDIPEQTQLSRAMERIQRLNIDSKLLFYDIERIVDQYGRDCWWEGYDNHKAKAEKEKR